MRIPFELLWLGDNLKSDFILYTSFTGGVKLELFLQDETIWLTQKMMAGLFDVEVNTLNYHLKEIFKNAELSENAAIQKIRTTAELSKEAVIRKFRTS